jgi:uncharacterized membrane-anchored protein
MQGIYTREERKVMNKMSINKNLNQLLNKVPEIMIFFWIIKIMATTVDETGADFLSFNLNWGMTNTTYLISGLLLIALFFQFRSKKYVPGIYWLAVLLISVVGTLITDNLVDNFRVSLITTTIVFILAMLATFAAWYANEKTLSIPLHLHDQARSILLVWRSCSPSP